MLHKIGWLVLPTAVVGTLLAMTALWLVGNDQPAVQESKAKESLSAKESDPLDDSIGSNQFSNVQLTSAKIDAFLASSEWDTSDGSKTLTGANLLASRFYDLRTDTQGRIVYARMPSREDNRFGPPTEETAAILELSHLEELDLGNTLASAAVPLANRHPGLRVLVLEDQTDAASLARLRGIEELRLINSEFDETLLVSLGIRITHVGERRRIGY